MIRGALPAAALLWGLAGCAASPTLAERLPAGVPRAVELAATPFFPQEAYQCGPAALATVLSASGQPTRPEELTPQVFLPEKYGSLQAELLGAARRHGRLPYVMPQQADEMVAELNEGRPVLVLQNLGLPKFPRWHYAVLIGYDADKNVAILRSGTDKRVAMRWQRFAGSWHRGGRWAVTTLKPGEIPQHADAARYVEAAAGLEAAGKHAEAGASYDAAIKRWPDAPLAWLGRGNVLYAAGNLAEAADSYQRAVLLAPDDAAARNNLAQVLGDAGCTAESKTQIERAVALAAGTALAGVVEETRAKVSALPSTICLFVDRKWPD